MTFGKDRFRERDLTSRNTTELKRYYVDVIGVGNRVSTTKRILGTSSIQTMVEV